MGLQRAVVGMRSESVHCLLCLYMVRHCCRRRFYLSHGRYEGGIKCVCHAQSLQLLLTMAFRLLAQCHTFLRSQRYHGLVETIDGWVLLPVDVRVDVARQGLLFFFGGIVCLFL